MIILPQGRAALEQGFAITVDIGKTLSKVTLWSKDGRCLHRLTRPNAPQTGAMASLPYAPLDLSGISDWLLEALKDCAGKDCAGPNVEAIIPVTHGAAIAGICDSALTVSPLDYEWEIPTEVLASYRAGRDPFAITGSPALPAGLNIGSQLHYLEALAPAAFHKATLLPWAQYWAWWLSGVAASEVSSLGCHSDLWSPAQGDYSPMARRRGWAAQFAPMAQAGEAIGTLRPDLAQRTGLSSKVRVHAGLHDSNAALLAARSFAEVGGREATVLSTGTWFIAMRSPQTPVDLTALPEARDCLVNVDVFGQPVPSARFMGGREIALLGQRIDHAGTNGLADVLYAGAMVVPSQLPGCGPFPGTIGRWLNRPHHADEQAAAVALYAALMADAALDLIGASDTLLVEGRFATSEIFVRALAKLRPDMRLFTASEEADVSFGALRLLLPELTPKSTLTPVEPLARDLDAYRDDWYDAIAAFS